MTTSFVPMASAILKPEGIQVGNYFLSNPRLRLRSPSSNAKRQGSFSYAIIFKFIRTAKINKVDNDKPCIDDERFSNRLVNGITYIWVIIFLLRRKLQWVCCLSGWSKLTKNFSMATTNSVLMTSSVLTTRATQSGGNSGWLLTKHWDSKPLIKATLPHLFLARQYARNIRPCFLYTGHSFPSRLHTNNNAITSLDQYIRWPFVWTLVILVFVTPTALLPTANKPKTKTCELVAGTKEPGYLQSFTGDIERCPKNISDCALVGDAETQQSCRTCCAVNITIAGECFLWLGMFATMGRVFLKIDLRKCSHFWESVSYDRSQTRLDRSQYAFERSHSDYMPIICQFAFECFTFRSLLT